MRGMKVRRAERADGQRTAASEVSPLVVVDAIFLSRTSSAGVFSSSACVTTSASVAAGAADALASSLSAVSAARLDNERMKLWRN